MNNISENIDFIKSIKMLSQPKDNIDGNNDFVDVSTKPLEVMLFTGYSELDEQNRILSNKGNVKELMSDISYNDVFIIGTALGHYRGVYCPIKTNEMVLVGWLDSSTPVILGSINDSFSESPDNIPNIKEDELLIVSKTAGTIIFVRDDNSVLIKTKNGSKIRLNNSGHFKIFNKDDYGIECDEDGNLILRGKTITAVDEPGEF